ncbi:hypothetical protein ACQ4LE_005827 [Meloidogyne hapla]
MESLPYGPIIDTLKCLDFNQLFALKQTNKYFKTLIGRYEHLLARKEFHCIFIINPKPFKMIDLKSGLFYFQVTSQLEEKWQSALNAKIPIYLNTSGMPLREEQTALMLKKDGDNGNFDKTFTLKLPVFPKSIEDLKIIYCWLFHLSRCGYSCANFSDFILNPELIKLIFEDNIQLKFHVKDVGLNYFNPNREIVLKFNLEHLIIYRHLLLNFHTIDNTEEFNDILLKLVVNEGYKIPQILFHHLKQLTLHNLILNYIETSDCSKMIKIILFTFKDCPRINLGIRAEKIVNIKKSDSNCVSYELSNIYNQNMKYSIVNIEKEELTFGVCVRRIK